MRHATYPVKRVTRPRHISEAEWARILGTRRALTYRKLHHARPTRKIR